MDASIDHLRILFWMLIHNMPNMFKTKIVWFSIVLGFKRFLKHSIRTVILVVFISNPVIVRLANFDNARHKKAVCRWIF
ncbi:hypothetical protein GIB67_036095, partial [Kingdonia uniflora]